MGKKLLSLIFSMMLVISVVIIPASAAPTEPVDPDTVASNQIEPRAFSRDYKDVYITGSEHELMGDDNWFGEHSVTVTMKSTSGPSKVKVIVYHSGSVVSSGTIDVNTAFHASVPAGSFDIVVYKTAGSNGTVTFNVTLS